MAKQCTFCNHADRASLENALLSQEITQQKVADILGVNRSSVSRHMRDHVRKAVAEAVSHDRELESGLNVTKQLMEINNVARGIAKKALEAKDYRLALKSIERIEKQLELQAKLLGDIATGVNIVVQSPQFVEFKTLILGVLDDHPDVKAQVVDRLRGLLDAGTN